MLSQGASAAGGTVTGENDSSAVLEHAWGHGELRKRSLGRAGARVGER